VQFTHQVSTLKFNARRNGDSDKAYKAGLIVSKYSFSYGLRYKFFTHKKYQVFTFYTSFDCILMREKITYQTNDIPLISPSKDT
jgi:hypothetical protein